jgi:hypothetical protein
MPLFVLGQPPVNQQVDSPGWIRLAGYGASVPQMLGSIGVGLALAIGVALVWRAVDSNSLPLGQPSLLDVLLFTSMLMFGHEALHLMGFPGAGLSRNSVCGIWPQAGSPFVLHLQPMTRDRFLVALTLPFLVISLCPLALRALGYPIGNFFAWASTLNSVGAGADILAFALLLRTAPRRAEILESDHALYWKV